MPASGPGPPASSPASLAPPTHQPAGGRRTGRSGDRRYQSLRALALQVAGTCTTLLISRNVVCPSLT